MGFLNPGLLGLLGLGAVPILIHLLNRRRYQVVKWPAMQFLLKAQVKTRQRLRLENLLLLLARTLAVLLFALAASRPFLPSAEALAALGPDRQHLYILVDNSASMGYQEGISTLLQRAVREASSAVDNAIRPDDPVTLVVACDESRRRNGRPAALLRGTVNHAMVKEALERIPLSDARMDPAAALSEVAAVADPSDPRRTLLVLSDFQQGDWAPAEAGGPGAATEAIRAQLDRLEQKRFDLRGAFRFLGSPDPEDIGVFSVGPADGRAPAEGVPVSFEVVVGNNGPAPAAADVRFLVDGREQGAQRVALRGRPSRAPSPETARVAFRWTGSAGPHHAEAAVTGSGNRWAASKDRAGNDRTANDRRGHAFSVREKVRVLLADGDPAPPEGRFPETRLLEVALSLRRGVVPADVRVVPASDLARESLDGVDVAVVANADSLPDAFLDRLSSFVRRGGGLLVFLGEKVDPSLWNSVFRRPGCEDLLPARLAAAPRLDPESPVSVELAASAHPALRDLTDPRAGTSFEPPLVSGWWPVEEAAGEGVEVLLRLRDLARSPYLLERHHGRGRSVLCTSTADLDWTGPSLLFAPLVQELVSYLASAGSERRDLSVHEAIACEVPETARAFTVTGPDGQLYRDVEATRPGGEEGAAGASRAVVFPGTGIAGMYAVRWQAPAGGGGIGGEMEGVERFYSVNLDPRECDVARLTPGSLGERLGRAGLSPAEDGGAAAARKEREREAARGDLTAAAVGLGLLMVLAEMFLAAFFGRRRR